MCVYTLYLLEELKGKVCCISVSW